MKTEILWEYKVGNNANFVCLWKTRMPKERDVIAMDNSSQPNLYKDPTMGSTRQKTEQKYKVHQLRIEFKIDIYLSLSLSCTNR